MPANLEQIVSSSGYSRFRKNPAVVRLQKAHPGQGGSQVVIESSERAKSTNVATIISDNERGNG